MKRLIGLILSIALPLSLLSGCGQHMKEPVTFYYLKSAYEEKMDCPIAGEQREASGQRDNLKYTLSLYLMGPIGKDLVSPLPRGTLLYTVTQEDDMLTIELSNTSAQLSDSEYSLACACLSLTCMELTNAEAVTIVSGNRSLTLSMDNLLLNDTLTPEETAK